MMSDIDMNTYLEAIQEFVDNKDYFTPSPLEEAPPEEENFTFVFPQEVYYEQQPYYNQMTMDGYEKKEDLPADLNPLFQNNNMLFLDNNTASPKPMIDFTTSAALPASAFQKFVTTIPPPPTPASVGQDDEADDDTEEIIMNFNLDQDTDELRKTENNIISDDDLVNLPVRQLNIRLKNITREEKVKVKSRRRLLKNRGYAQTCRERRITNQRNLAEENAHLKQLLEKMTLERNTYQTKYTNLKNIIKKAKIEKGRRLSQTVVQ